MVRFPNDPAAPVDTADVFHMLQRIERKAQRDAEALAQRADPYAQARVEITLKVLGEARETKQRLARGQVVLSEAATVATDLHDMLMPTLGA